LRLDYEVGINHRHSRLIPCAYRKFSTFLSESGCRIYSITASWIISGLFLSGGRREGANLAANSLPCQRQPLRASAKLCATFFRLIGRAPYAAQHPEGSCVTVTAEGLVIDLRTDGIVGVMREMMTPRQPEAAE